jgi:hypothetical protein
MQKHRNLSPIGTGRAAKNPLLTVQKTIYSTIIRSLDKTISQFSNSSLSRSLSVPPGDKMTPFLNNNSQHPMGMSLKTPSEGGKEPTVDPTR